MKSRWQRAKDASLRSMNSTLISNSLRPRGLYPTRLLCPWGFSRQEYLSGLPCPPPGNLPNLGTEPRSPTRQVDSLPSELPRKPYMLPATLIPIIFSKEMKSVFANTKNLYMVSTGTLFQKTGNNSNIHQEVNGPRNCGILT